MSKFKVGHIIDFRMSNHNVLSSIHKNYGKKYKNRMGEWITLTDKTNEDILESFGKVIETFGSVIRVSVQYDDGDWEFDIKDRFLIVNVQETRELRLKEILNDNR